MVASLSNAEWGEQYNAIKTYVGNREGKGPKLSILRGFFNWLARTDGEGAGLLPDELIEFQIRKRGEAYESRRPNVEFYVPGLVRDYIRSNPSWRVKYKKTIASTIHAFFKANCIELPRNGEVVRAAKHSKKRRVNKDKWITIKGLEKLRSMIDGNTNLMYKTAMLCMLSSGMGMDEIVEWSNQGIETTRKALEKGIHGKPIIKIYLSARKDLDESRDFHTYVFTSDAIDSLREWIKERDARKERWEKRNKGKRFEDRARGALFLSNHNTPLKSSAFSAYFLYRAKELGIIEEKEGADRSTRYGFSPHIIRNFFKSWFWKSPAPDWIADAMMGHIVDNNDYMKLFNDDRYILEQLEKTGPFLNILSSPTPFDQVNEAMVEEKLKQRDVEIKKLQRLVAQLQKLKIDDVITRVEREYEAGIAEMMDEIKKLKGSMGNLTENLGILQDAVNFAKYKAANEEERRRRT